MNHSWLLTLSLVRVVLELANIARFACARFLGKDNDLSSVSSCVIFSQASLRKYASKSLLLVHALQQIGGCCVQVVLKS